MASRSKLSVSRSVALSLAALLVLSGAMFVVTTLQQDSEVWVLVEDQVLDESGIMYDYTGFGSDSTAEYTFVFDEESATYTYDLTGGTRAASSVFTLFGFSATDAFDYSKDYKYVVTSELRPQDFSYYTVISGGTVLYKVLHDLRSAPIDDDGIYNFSVFLYGQNVHDFEYKSGFYLDIPDSSASTTYGANEVTLQVYELQTDNTGSIAAGVTGLLLIVMGVFAMPMHNILRRK